MILTSILQIYSGILLLFLVAFQEASALNFNQIQAKFVPPGATTQSSAGYAVAMSSDGTTAAIGMPNTKSNPGVGGVVIMTRSGSAWSQQGTTLLGTGNTGNSQQGSSIALSADGNTLVIGGPNDDSAKGAIWVFQRSGSTWSQDGSSKLVESSQATNALLGRSVAISADGNTIVAGRTLTDGGAVVFSRNVSTWSQQGTRLIGDDYTSITDVGNAVAISADGTRIIFAGVGNDGGGGALWVFDLDSDSNVWNQNGNNYGISGTFRLGTSLAFAVGDESIIAAGSVPNESDYEQGVYLFGAYDSTSYAGSALVIQPATGTFSERLGIAVTMSSTGSRLIIGDDSINPSGSNYTGGCFSFGETAQSQYTQQGASYISGTGGIFNGNTYIRQGSALATDSAGLFLIMGGYGDNGYTVPTTSPSSAPTPFSIAATGYKSISKITPGGLGYHSRFGFSVAMSTDGSTTVASQYEGKSYVYIRSGSDWVQQGGALFGTGDSGGGTQGDALAISANGNTFVVAGWYYNGEFNEQGAVWVFNRSGTTWVQDGPAIVESDPADTAILGTFVAMSAAGTTIAAGRRGSDGGVVVFVREASGWVQQGQRLTGDDRENPDSPGIGGAMTADGKRVFYSDPYDNLGQGAFWAFDRNSSNVWNQVGSKVAITGTTDFAYTFACSSDGTYVVATAAHSHVFVLKRSGSTYVNTTTVSTAEVSRGVYGLAITALGDRLIFSSAFTPPGVAPNTYVGSVYVFTRSEESWTQQGQYIRPANYIFNKNKYIGISRTFATSGDGVHLVIGGYGDDYYTGAVWFFEEVIQSSAPTVTKSPTFQPTSTASHCSALNRWILGLAISAAHLLVLS